MMMRRLPQKEREMVPDRVAEQTVQTIAAHSWSARGGNRDHGGGAGQNRECRKGPGNV